MADIKNKKSELIMKAALEIFEEKDFREATIAEIAKRASVATGTIYEYFSSKEDLYFSIPNKTTMSFNEQLLLQLGGLYDPIEKIRKYIWFYFYFFEQNPIYAELLLMELRVNRNFTSSEYYQGARNATIIILGIVKEGQEQGVIRGDINPLIIRNMILGPLEHFTTYWLISGKKIKLTTYTKEFTTLIISAIEAKMQNDSDPTDQV